MREAIFDCVNLAASVADYKVFLAIKVQKINAFANDNVVLEGQCRSELMVYAYISASR